MHYAPTPPNGTTTKSPAGIDDMIAFSTGGKLRPGPIETFLSTSAPGLISGLIIAGIQRRLSLSPRRARFLTFSQRRHGNFQETQIWLLIQESNSRAPMLGRIFNQECIIITKPDTPLPRTEERTV